MLNYTKFLANSLMLDALKQFCNITEYVSNFVIILEVLLQEVQQDFAGNTQIIRIVFLNLYFHSQIYYDSCFYENEKNQSYTQ